MQIETVEAMHFHRFSVVFSLSQSAVATAPFSDDVNGAKDTFFSCIFSIENW